MRSMILVCRNFPASVLTYLLAVVFVFGIACTITARAEETCELPLKLQLIWGTDMVPKTDKFKKVDDSIKERLDEFLKWKNYYVISCKNVTLTDEKVQSVRMSKKCEIKISRIENNIVEVRLFGEDKLIIKKKAKITPKKPQCLAGRNEENADFWGVIISVDDKNVEKNEKPATSSPVPAPSAPALPPATAPAGESKEVK